MRRLIATLLAGLIALAAIVTLTAAGGDDSSHKSNYRVYGIFDSAAFAIPNEEVRISGVKVGKIDKVEVTSDNKAAITMLIQEPGYQDFRKDARCTVRPQSLIGEKFVDCELTQPHPAGEALPAELTKIPKGKPGAGAYYLPVDRTGASVDLDLVNDMLQLPYRQRLTLIVNELGVGLAGRGKDLNDTIARADPTLQATGDVLRLLARQNKTLQNLASESDTVLAPLARDRARVADSIDRIGSVAQATAERRADLEADLQKLPAALRQIKPTMDTLSTFADQATPVLTDLGVAAPSLSKFLQQLGPFSRAGIPAFKGLGDASVKGTPAVKAARPVAVKLNRTVTDLRPVVGTLRQVLESFQKNSGIERVMDYIFFQVAAINGYDAVGHYLRAHLIVNNCATYAVEPVGGCVSKFDASSDSTTTATAAAAASQDPVLLRTAKVLNGAKPSSVLDKKSIERNKAATRALQEARGKVTVEEKPSTGAAKSKSKSGKSTAPAAASPQGQTDAAPQAPAGTTPAPADTPAANQQSLLDYLFGNGP